jgi:hypothetical protein
MSTPDQEVHARAQKLVEEEGCSYGKALRTVLASDEALARRYRTYHLGSGEPNNPIAERLAAKVKRAMQEDNLSYVAALKRVLASDKELERRYLGRRFDSR